MTGVPKRYEPDAMEKEVLQRWRRDGVFSAQLASGRAAWEASGRREDARYVFLEGPPTANGLPHPGHVLTRTLKDAVCRFHAMHGKWVPRKAGWDCHGLPVEIEVQKELGIEHVDEIEAYGVEPFLAKCKESVFRYKGEWEAMSERVGFWLDYTDPYVTMDDGYIDCVWWSLKRLFDAGLLVKSHKVVPYSPITGTTYSSHEVAQGYRDVVDTSVYVKFHLVEDPDDARILSWTTTPWTLPGNVALAVGEDVDYVRVRVTQESPNAHAAVGEVLVLAKDLFKQTLRNHAEVVAEMKGRDLVGLRYAPLFPDAVDGSDAKVAWQVVAADFVTTEDGTGVVHTAVMYGEDDHRLGMAVGLPAQHTVGLDGRFLAHVPAVAGMYVKDDATEEAILLFLREKDMLYRTEAYKHSYPHCWRTETPLLYYAMESWFIRMSVLRDGLLANNDKIHWVPDAIRDGRMGDWLRNVKDWAFSRSRYWGTPLPVWTCTSEACGHQVCVGGKEELASHGVSVPELHRPHVDVPIRCPKCGGEAQREPYVIDVWYDSGAAQFAQWHLSADRGDRLAEQWPIDFIAEGLDQTRGWFYSLLAIATALGASKQGGTDTMLGADPAGLFVGPPYRNCVVNGLILAEDGQKMSKSKKNYVSPDVVFAHVGADATRWYLLSATAPWQDKRFYEDAVRETFGRFFSTLWNSFLFWHQYAQLDGWKPSLSALDSLQDLTAASPLDRWLLSRLEATVLAAEEEGQRYHLHKATRAIEAFVLDDLSNWWVRRSRDRFWGEADSPDKQSAHATLWWALHTVCRLVAPYAPFMVEHIWQHVRLPEDPDSVHLAHYPEPAAEGAGRDLAQDAQMAQVRALAEAGRALRSKVGVPTRHPLAKAIVPELPQRLEPEYLSILGEELNVKEVGQYPGWRPQEAKRPVLKANPAMIGPKFKAESKKVTEAISSLDREAAERIVKLIQQEQPIHIVVDGKQVNLGADDVLVDWVDSEGWASTLVTYQFETGKIRQVPLALYTKRDQALLDEAFAREVIRRVQELRKELDLAIDARIELQLAGKAMARLQPFAKTLQDEVRATKVSFHDALARPMKVWDVDGESVACGVDATGLQHGLVGAA